MRPKPLFHPKIEQKNPLHALKKIFHTLFCIQTYIVCTIMLSRKAPEPSSPLFLLRTRPPLGPECNLWGWKMTFAPVVWSVWGILVALMAALHIYRASLTRDEEDQIFLDDSFEHEKTTQAAIAAKVNKVEPILSVFKWLVGVASLLVLAYYFREIAVVQLHLL